jgi:hypothetical protein
MSDSVSNSTPEGPPQEKPVRPTREQLLEAALGYASQGTYVIPLCIGGKTPVTPNGFHDATTDPNQIRSWWTLYPYSIGVPTGRLNGFDVVDVDVNGFRIRLPSPEEADQ